MRRDKAFGGARFADGGSGAISIDPRLALVWTCVHSVTGKDLQLPRADALTIRKGGGSGFVLILHNATASFTQRVKDGTGTSLTSLSAGRTIKLYLQDTSSGAGLWSWRKN